MRRLTPRELEVMRLRATGLSVREVADALGISVQTVKNHQTAVYAKAEAAGIVDFFYRVGWLRPGGHE